MLYVCRPREDLKWRFCSPNPNLALNACTSHGDLPEAVKKVLVADAFNIGSVPVESRPHQVQERIINFACLQLACRRASIHLVHEAAELFFLEQSVLWCVTRMESVLYLFHDLFAGLFAAFLLGHAQPSLELLLLFLLLLSQRLLPILTVHS